MLRAFSTAATGMSAQQMMVDVIANNLANINTTGFKRSQINFQDLLYVDVEQSGTEVSSGLVSPSGLEVGSGVGRIYLGSVGGHDDLVDVLGPETRVIQRSACRSLGQIDTRLAIGGKAAPLDTGARHDPLVGRVDETRPVLVGHYPFRRIPAEAQHTNPISTHGPSCLRVREP